MTSPPSDTDLVDTEPSEKEKEGDSGQGPRKPGAKAQGRKRTKTGCLTCRRRRIKCGEERPTCQNCTKSKRQCEGYNQRVVFKDPLNAYRGPPISAHVQFSEPILPVHHNHPIQQSGSGSGSGPPPIAPKPSFEIPVAPTDNVVALPTVTSPGLERRVYGFNSDPNQFSTGSTGQKAPRPGFTGTFEVTYDTVDQSHIPEPRNRKSPPDQVAHYDFEALEPVKQESRDGQIITPAGRSHLDWSAGPSTPATFYRSYQSSSNWHPQSNSPPLVTATAAAANSTSNTGPYSPQDSTHPGSGHASQNEYRHSHFHLQHPPAAAPGSDWAWKQPIAKTEPEDYPNDDDDDPFDVSDDESMEDHEGGEGGPGKIQDHHLRNNDLGVVVALQARQETRNLNFRSITSYIDRPNMLATYVPSSQASPLQDPMAARIFCHFINVTGPTMSMFERHPANPSLIFQGHPIPRSQQHIWTYTFPTLALHNQGLLHAMLAVASLHIAKLQNGPITASMKHYAFGLRKVAKALSLHNRRRHPATLAAAMLLAFYECWSADHQKWSNHLLGARMLLQEIDFAGMTKHISSLRSKEIREVRDRGMQALQQGVEPLSDHNRRYQVSEDVNENIVSMLMGKKLKYDQFGRIMEESIPDDNVSKNYTERDMEIFETQRDLFWWYCKQDAYQSILGGGRLFMEYDRWSHCPPRAPLGRLSATYGTFDHLILLMGRLADFASKDVKRKRLAMKANGGYRPPGMPAHIPGQQGPALPPTQMPPFNGMVPDVGEPKLPMGFDSSRDHSPQSTHSTQSEEVDLDILKAEAEEEWQEIRNAFGVLEDHFGDDFQALGPEFSAPIQTPFGPALQYRTYGIAGIWMNYYMSLITCHRVHPSMPPAAMMASGIAARHTDWFANEIGRISAGIAPDCSMTAEVSPGVGAALIESSTALFIAGVQYQNTEQRHWTVNRLRDIARLTGWQTANAICTGIETSWLKVAEVGKGPPYVRTSEERIVPDVRRHGDFHMGLILEWILSAPEI